MFTLIDLPYASLAPVISDQTLSFHHGKHLKGYVDKLNELVAGTPLEEKSLEEVILGSTGATFNQAGQILNHNLYFTQFRSFVADAPQDDTTCHSERSEESGICHSERSEESPLLKQITTQWGTLTAFQKEFETKGATIFGSGWVWLQADAKGELSIAQYAGADNPVAHGLKPILTFDVWEHAYYLDYQNRRPAHLSALWNIVDWKVLERRYQ